MSEEENIDQSLGDSIAVLGNESENAELPGLGLLKPSTIIHEPSTKYSICTYCLWHYHLYRSFFIIQPQYCCQ